MLGMGDTDEVAWRNNVNMLKYCETSGPIDIGIWFPMRYIEHAFRADHNPGGFQYALGDPTFHRFSDAKVKYESKGNELVTRNRGHSGRFLLGGMHMSNSKYAPHALIKDLTCTECSLSAIFRIKNITDYGRAGNAIGLEREVVEYAAAAWGNRATKISDLDAKHNIKEIKKLPWFLECNLERYPNWLPRRHDTRIEN